MIGRRREGVSQEMQEVVFETSTVGPYHNDRGVTRTLSRLQSEKEDRILGVVKN